MSIQIEGLCSCVGDSRAMYFQFVERVHCLININKGQGKSAKPSFAPNFRVPYNVLWSITDKHRIGLSLQPRNGATKWATIPKGQKMYRNLMVSRKLNEVVGMLLNSTPANLFGAASRSTKRRISAANCTNNVS